eukprot:scaffold59671_cov20-Tisochrysis_lutea.AAC.1
MSTNKQSTRRHQFVQRFGGSVCSCHGESRAEPFKRPVLQPLDLFLAAVIAALQDHAGGGEQCHTLDDTCHSLTHQLNAERLDKNKGRKELDQAYQELSQTRQALQEARQQ